MDTIFKEDILYEPDVLDEIYLPNLNNESVKEFLYERINEVKKILALENASLFYDDWDMFRLLLKKCFELKVIKSDFILYIINLLLNQEVVFNTPKEREEYIINRSKLELVKEKLENDFGGRKKIKH